MKVVVVTFMALFPGIYSFGKWLLKWTWLGEQDDFQVVLCVHLSHEFDTIPMIFQRNGHFPDPHEYHTVLAHRFHR